MQAETENLNVTSMRTITPVPLVAEQFKSFGDVIEHRARPREINYGLTESSADLAQLDLYQNAGRPRVSLYRSQPLQPIVIRRMECHQLGSQLFMPLGGHPYLVVVAPKGDFEAGAISVFRAEGHQGVNYHPGVWHHFCLPLHPNSDFLVVDRFGGAEDDTHEIELSEAQQFQVTAQS